MEPKFQSSFIPRGPIGSQATISQSSVSGGRGIFGFLATIIFILSVIGTGGIFGYNKYLASSISQMGSDLEAARTTLEPESIKELTRLNSRIVTTQELLTNHTVLSPLFEYLESSTVKTVRFSQFNYSTTDKGLTLVMKGQARGYSAVALQADIFSKSKYIKNPIFSDLSLDNSGNVIFSLTSTLDPSIISYKKQLEGTAPTVVPVVVPVATTSTPVVLQNSTTTATTTKVNIPKR